MTQGVFAGDRSQPTGQAIGCLILHGLGGGPFELTPLIDQIKQSGAEVEAPVFPGHHQHSDRMPRSEWPQWYQTALESLKQLATRADRLVIVAFSTGCLIALKLALEHSVERLVLLAPFLRVRHYWFYGIRPEWAMQTIGRWIHEVPRRPPAVRGQALKEELDRQTKFKTFNLDAARSALALIAEVCPQVEQIRLPVLVIQSEQDTVVDPKGAHWLSQKLGTQPANLELLWLKRSDHLLVWDLDRQEVIDRVIRFLFRTDSSEGSES